METIRLCSYFPFGSLVFSLGGIPFSFVLTCISCWSFAKGWSFQQDFMPACPVARANAKRCQSTNCTMAQGVGARKVLSEWKAQEEIRCFSWMDPPAPLVQYWLIDVLWYIPLVVKSYINPCEGMRYNQKPNRSQRFKQQHADNSRWICWWCDKQGMDFVSLKEGADFGE